MYKQNITHIDVNNTILILHTYTYMAHTLIHTEHRYVIIIVHTHVVRTYTAHIFVILRLQIYVVVILQNYFTVDSFM